MDKKREQQLLMDCSAKSSSVRYVSQCSDITIAHVSIFKFYNNMNHYFVVSIVNLQLLLLFHHLRHKKPTYQCRLAKQCQLKHLCHCYLFSFYMNVLKHLSCYFIHGVNPHYFLTVITAATLSTLEIPMKQPKYFRCCNSDA